MEIIIEQLRVEYNHSVHTHKCVPLRGTQRRLTIRWAKRCICCNDALFLCMWILDHVRCNVSWSVQMAAVHIANKAHGVGQPHASSVIKDFKWPITAQKLQESEVFIMEQLRWHVPLLMMTVCVSKFSSLFPGMDIYNDVLRASIRAITITPGLHFVDICMRSVSDAIKDDVLACKYWKQYTTCLYNTLSG